MIPETKLLAVKQALQKTFGVSELEDISKLTAGLSSALVFRIVVQGKSYLLRIITRTDEMSDPTNQFACMKVAAEAGIAPRIWYLSIEDRISITDFIESQPFPLDEAKTKVPELMHRLHMLPNFQKPIMQGSALDGFIEKFHAANIISNNQTKELFQQYGRVKKVYPRNEDVVSCHNDLKPENILFDGEQVWLIDWEAAFLNDRYADLAVVANFVVKNDEDELEYLENYFKEPATDYQRARFFLMRQETHMFYFVVFMLFGAKGQKVDANMERANFRAFHDRIWRGEIDLHSDEAKVQYALVHMDQMLKNIRTERFENSLRIVSNYHTNK
ncbi:phosphotransferase [Priestia megaterium]|uniref:phosphotransferase n=1 Tax=Priestia megaterium TaxID=1404 RepID=UPI000E1B4648|nr:phosphotransferase [Priestia megaterium]SSY69848.1 aminoglycoside phosphotransferase family protein [Priestia megaterium]